MHKEILSAEQLGLLPLLKSFSRSYYLAGGTAIGLHLGHRKSIDFDLFRNGKISPFGIIEKIKRAGYSPTVMVRTEEQMNLLVNHVKLTFLEYPFPVNPQCRFDGILRMPSLPDLAAMKAYALGRRSKWKDYADLYFILRDHLSIEQISRSAVVIFGNLYSEKMFRAQLSYFNDIDYTEPVDYRVPAPPESEIRDFLSKAAIDF